MPVGVAVDFAFTVGAQSVKIKLRNVYPLFFAAVQYTGITGTGKTRQIRNAVKTVELPLQSGTFSG